jgi:hypothetical protein
MIMVYRETFRMNQRDFDDEKQDQTVMEKQELLKNAIDQGNDYGYLNWDSILDLCDEDPKLIKWLDKELTNLDSKGELEFELDF